MKPHKHAELIKAWADGATIQRRIIRNGENIDEPIISYSWLTENMPMWSIHEEYRIKPEPKPESVEKPMYIYYSRAESKVWIDDNPPEKFLYKDLYTYVGEIQVKK